ncbi:hypothetical protein [Nostoc sp. 'Peltigera membranacea cyanobiont' 210A]|uniref:hypothetical protein n=1 Tax=Nostoc sp. 'Peltigera membranacea cyanobiont' 210A TaxID=2014529 RepID=UPI00117EC94A|nr:hypothetical protein [Nostoc sp. 'Peltigera membranacea cyanobiont' 210A]
MKAIARQHRPFFSIWHERRGTSTFFHDSLSTQHHNLGFQPATEQVDLVHNPRAPALYIRLLA